MEQAADPHPILHMARAVCIWLPEDPCWFPGPKGRVAADSFDEVVVPTVALLLLLSASIDTDLSLTFIADEEVDTLMTSPPGLIRMGEKIRLWDDDEPLLLLVLLVQSTSSIFASTNIFLTTPSGLSMSSSEETNNLAPDNSALGDHMLSSEAPDCSAWMASISFMSLQSSPLSTQPPAPVPDILGPGPKVTR